MLLFLYLLFVYPSLSDMAKVRILQLVRLHFHLSQLPTGMLLSSSFFLDDTDTGFKKFYRSMQRGNELFYRSMQQGNELCFLFERPSGLLKGVFRLETFLVKPATSFINVALFWSFSSTPLSMLLVKPSFSLNSRMHSSFLPEVLRVFVPCESNPVYCQG